MDDRRFDQLTRALGGATTRRSALGALAGLLAGGAVREADAKKRRKKCDPECPAGQTCRQGTCTCDNGGAVCGTACCRTGQRCENGACVTPPPQCLAFGAACKNAGAPCCDGLACGSGQGGLGDVACFVPAGGPCQSTADCVYDSVCTDGVCVAIPQPTPAPQCVPTIPSTGNPAADGAALKAAWVAAAQSGGDAEIVLGSGTYEVPAPTNAVEGSLDWRVPGSITLRACDGTDAVVTVPDGQGGNAALFTLVVGSMTLRGLTIDAKGWAYGIAASSNDQMLTLDECTVRNASTSGAVTYTTMVTVIGGDYTGNTAAGLTNFGSGPLFTCSGGPRGGCCVNVGPACAACGCTSCGSSCP